MLQSCRTDAGIHRDRLDLSGKFLQHILKPLLLEGKRLCLFLFCFPFAEGIQIDIIDSEGCHHLLHASRHGISDGNDGDYRSDADNDSQHRQHGTKLIGL